MKHIKRKFIGGLIFVFALFQLGFAQETEKEEKEEKIYKLPQVVVTAPEVKGMPGRTTLITKEEIGVKNTQNAIKILEHVPGVHIRPEKRRGGRISLRGIAESKTYILLDDSILNDSFHQNVFWNIIPIDMIERVEIIPGPFSALYGGRGGLGGTVKIITRMPEKQEFFVKGVYGSDNMMRGTASYGNKLFDRLSLYICADYMKTDGYVSDYITKSAKDGTGDIPVTGWEKTTDSKGNPVYLIGDRGKQESWEWSVLSKLRFHFSEFSWLTFTFCPSQWNYGTSSVHLDSSNSYLKDANGETVNSGIITFDDGGQKEIDLGTTLLGGISNKSERYRYNLAYEIKFKRDFKLKATAEYVDETGRGDSQTPTTGATFDEGPGKLSLRPMDRWQGRIETKLNDIFGFNNIIFGADYMKEEGGRENYYVTNWRDESTKGELIGKSWGISSVYSLFVQDEMILVKDCLILYLGGRLDYWEVSELMDWHKWEKENKYPDRDEKYFSPKSSIKYIPFESTTLRLSLAKAFTSPRLHDILGGASTLNEVRLSSYHLKPEKATCWEAGADQKIFDIILVRATYFENYLRDYKYDERWKSGGLNYRVAKTGGKAIIRGVEGEIIYQITKFLKAYTSMTYQKTEVTEDKKNPEKEGKRMTNVPRTMYNFGLLMDNFAGFIGSITGRYVGKVYADSSNEDTTNNVPGSYDPHFTMDAKLGYEIIKGMILAFSVDNIFDEQYYENYKAPGRKFYGELSYRF